MLQKDCSEGTGRRKGFLQATVRTGLDRARVVLKGREGRGESTEEMVSWVRR